MMETKISSVGGGANNSASLKGSIVLLSGSNLKKCKIWLLSNLIIVEMC